MKIVIVLAIAFVLVASAYGMDAPDEHNAESIFDVDELESVDPYTGHLLIRTRRGAPCGGLFQASICNLRCVSERKKSKCGGGKCWCQ